MESWLNFLPFLHQHLTNGTSENSKIRGLQFSTTELVNSFCRTTQSFHGNSSAAPGENPPAGQHLLEDSFDLGQHQIFRENKK